MNPAQVPPFSQMADVTDVVRRCVQNRAQRLVSEEAKKAVTAWMLSTLTKTRLFLLRDKSQLLTVWKEIREEENVIDFVLGLTNDIRVQLALSEVPFEEISEYFAQALGQYRVADKDVSAIDLDLSERLPVTDEVKELYIGNPWFVTLLLLDHFGWEAVTILERSAPGISVGTNRR